MDGLTETSRIPFGYVYALLCMPWLAIGAVWLTRGSTGWARRLAVTAAGCVVVFTSGMAYVFARLAWINRW